MFRKDSVKFFIIWALLLSMIIYVAAKIVHNSIVKQKCAAEFEDPFKAYECLQERNW